LGPAGNAAIPGASSASFITHSEWNKQVFIGGDFTGKVQRVFVDGSGVYQVRTAGLPILPSAPTVTVGTPGALSYVYTFIFAFIYQVDQQSFEDLGPTLLVEVDNSSDPGVSPNAISAIPALANSATTNYDLSDIKVQIYRTVGDGTNSYKVGEVANGTTTFTDNVSDLLLQENAQLYTNDGTLDYYPPPQAKYIHIVNNVGYYVNTTDEFGTHIYRVHLSVPGNPALVPQLTWVEVADETTGIGSVKGLPILLTKKAIHRLDGVFSGAGVGGANPVKIHGTAGCISGASVIEAENYMFWAGNDGFYGTDGYQVTKISDHLNTRYKAMLAAMPNTKRIHARYDEINRLVYFTVELNAATTENDSLWILDLKRPLNTQSVFTTWSGNSFRPTAIEYFGGTLYRADNNGFVFKHDISVLSDPKVQTTVTAANWTQETIIWNYISRHFNFGGNFMRKFVSRILLQAQNAGNTTIQITAINDQGKKVRPLKLIRWRRNFTWGDPDFVWGNTDCIWDAEGLIEQWRRMPANGLRLSYLQIQITNGLGVIANSDSDGLCTLNKSTKQVVLPGLWPSDAVDYFLSFDADNYQRQFQVTAINGSTDTVTVLDPTNRLPATGSYKWQLMGYKKNEPLSLIGYNLHWDMIDQNQNTFAAGDLGGNS
jgi:hypothetical protein